MHILMVITSLQSGGAEKQFVELANSLSKQHEISVITLMSGDFRRGHLSSSVKVDSLEITSKFRAVANLRAVANARSITRGLAPELVISFNDPAALLVWLLQLSGVKLRHVVSERNANLGSWVRIAWKRMIYKKAAVVTANANATFMTLNSKSLLKSVPYLVVPNVVEVPLFSADLDERPVFKWISIARLELPKDHVSLFKAVALIRQTRQDFNLTLVGGGPLEWRLRTLAEELGIYDLVDFLGVRKDVSSLLCKSDALVLSSLWEGLPNVLLEAGAVGLPAVSTCVGGVEEAVPASVKKFLVAPGDPDALAHGMLEMMDTSRPIRYQMGQEMRDHVKNHFTRRLADEAWNSVLVTAMQRDPL